MFEATSSTEVRGAVEGRPLKLRSRVTNGSKMIAGVDGRSAEARRYRDLAMSFADDLGGADSLTEAQRALVRQAAALSVKSEKLQGDMISGKDVSDEQLTRVCNSLSRTLNRLGIKKRAVRKLSPLAAHFSLPPACEASE
jgi:hypothetical protein